jgi:hypothetical protein
MQPARAEGDGTSSTALRKWGPIGAIVVVAAVVIGIIFVTGGDDDGDATPPPTDSTPADTTQPDDDPPGSEPPATEPQDTAVDGTDPPAGGAITYPLSFSQAREQGIDVAWGDNCDQETGRLAVRDYFAPECFAPFEGDNGGATARGVTADSIKVVYYLGPDDDYIINYITDAISNDDTNADVTDTLQTMRDYYEQFYELYGRTVDLEIYVGTGIATDAVAARADAVRIAEDYQPFAVLGGPALTNAFADELAARQVLCISCGPTQPAAWYIDRDPYVWGIGAASRQTNAHVREMISKQLLGKNAEHAGDPAFQTQPRRFGLVHIESSAESAAIAEEFVTGLRADGADVAEVLPYQLDPASIQAAASQIIAKLKSAGVTTVIFSGDPIAPRDFTREATAQEYFPEWLVAASTLVDTTAFSRTYDQEQWAHAFGVSTLSARTTPGISGYYALYRWYTGEEPAAADTIAVIVPAMALFHSQLQATGPNLTPLTMREALFRAETRPAISQPYLSWGDRGIWPETDYNGIDDTTLLWWDPNATGPDEIRKDGVGMWQYVDGGRRYLPGQWPTEGRLFDPEGAVAIYPEAPLGEAPIEYPSPAG